MVNIPGISSLKRSKLEVETLRPISLLILSLLSLLDAIFLGNSKWAWEFHPLTIFDIMFESKPSEIHNPSTEIGRKQAFGKIFHLGIHDAARQQFYRPASGGWLNNSQLT